MFLNIFSKISWNQKYMNEIRENCSEYIFIVSYLPTSLEMVILIILDTNNLRQELNPVLDDKM